MQNAIGGVSRIDRNKRGAGQGNAPQGDDRVDRARNRDRHNVFGTDPFRGQTAGKRRCTGEEISVEHGGVTGSKGHRIA